MKRKKKSSWLSIFFTTALLLSTFFGNMSGPLVAKADSNPNYKVIGYFPSWGIYGRNFQVENIDGSKLTHINYAFADICWNGIHGNPSPDSPNKATWNCKDSTVPLQNKDVPNGTIVLGEPWADVSKSYPGKIWSDCEQAKCGNIGKLNDLKVQYPHLKTIISIGGWTWSNRFSDVAADPATRLVFAKSAVEFIRTYGFDGVDLDWEYPVSGGLSGNSYHPSDKQNYTLLLQAIRTELNKAELEDGKDYLLTIASGVSANYVTNTELDKISQTVDWINLMSYDFHGGWDTKTNHNAALYPVPNDPDKNLGFTIDEAVTRYAQAGVPMNKLVMGLPFYGRAWKGVANANNGEYQSITPGFDGTTVPMGTWDDYSSGATGVFDYGDIAANYVNKNGFTRYWNNTAKVPFLYNASTGVFMTYDDTESFGYKTDYIKSKGLAGGMFWELSSDCRTSSKYTCTGPKLIDKLASDLLGGGVSIPPDTQAPTVVSNLNSPSKTSSSIQLSWTASTDNVGVTSYEISYGSTKLTSTTTSLNVTGLQADTNYTFSVTAKDAAGNTSQAASITVKTNAQSTDTQAPTAVTNLSSPSKTTNSVQLSWTSATDNVGVTGYEISYGSTKLSTTATSINVTGLQANTNYTFAVTAKDAAGNTSQPTSITVQTNTQGGTTSQVNVTFTISSDWGTGFNYDLKIKNNGTAPINNWRLEFDYTGNITTIWDAKIVSKTGNHYVIESAGWNSVIAAGGTVSFGGGGSGASSPQIQNAVVTGN
nr:glycosyl hydrolase family 18 protein [Bacillus sp. EAC]